MKRHPVHIEAEVVYVETGTDALRVGILEDVHSVIGGETYTITYQAEYSKAVDWLDLDEDAELTFEVESTLASMDFPSSFVAELRERSLAPSGDGEPPQRTAYFAETMIEIWDTKGRLDDREDNPFY